MYIRRLVKKYKNKDGEIVEKVYYYKYKSIRRGKKVVSVYLGKANEEEFWHYQQEEGKRRNRPLQTMKM